MLPYPLEDFLQVGLHGLLSGMVDIGKFLDGSLLAPDAEIFPENQVLVRRQDAVKQGIDLLGDLKTGRTMEGIRPYTWSSNSLTSSGRRTLYHILALVTFFPLSVTSGSG